MKRLLAFLCASALCMSLVACGSKDSSDDEKVSSKYNDLIQMLEDEDYEDAIEYIRDLAGDEENTTENTDIMDILGGTDSGLDPKDSPLLSQLHGTWLKGGARARSENTVIVGLADVEYKQFTFNPDGTCLFDDKEMTWEPSSCTETSLSVNIHDGDTTSFTAKLNADESECTLTLYASYNFGSDSYSGMMGVATLFKPEYYEVVTVTQDNWRDYFEFTHADEYSFNSFGEANGLSISYRFSLKPEYFQRISSFTCVEGALELDYTMDSYDITVDYTNQSYTIGQPSDTKYIIAIGGTTGNPTFTLGMDGDDNDYYGCCYISGTVHSNVLSGYPTDMQVVRLQVTLYLTK